MILYFSEMMLLPVVDMLRCVVSYVYRLEEI